MTINCQGKLIDLTVPKVMGILNVTPDSFYEGSRSLSLPDLLFKVDKMLVAGAHFIDLGGYSSKPNAVDISEAEEINRLLPAIKALRKTFPEAVLSIDTFRSNVARIALSEGVALVNDISGGADQQMFATVASFQAPYIMMHMRGTPQNMNSLTHYDQLIQELNYFFADKIKQTQAAGIQDCIIDPGFGFAKTLEQNFEILYNLEQFQYIDAPLMVGLSRKSMIYKTLQTTPDFALNGTTFLHSIALSKGAKILRVHDVKEAVECVTLFQKLHGL